ncbi:hypothetical protein AWM75_04015 [Aerococcus urinaehominis]|uniref:Uncharacterized protein n=1 Tax=Aerococcus urinaehominis TaxID=128944 RepID=A0A0X8FL40_9LACT|nr:initiation control protein YabA [Aerococcus urinaehominis]AMB99222.1 hypothetical protein AWM75_04015 [Aerococcus urinaehominis]SDM31921.1 Regulator of replication initiation timing [Aerococcus urinaehominis]
MNNRDVTAELNDMQASLDLMQANLDKLNQSWQEVAVNNRDLETENRYLRERLQELTLLYETSLQDQVVNSGPVSVPSKENEGLSKARLNLKNIYDDGFHICNEFYGQKREAGTECLLCVNKL